MNVCLWVVSELSSGNSLRGVFSTNRSVWLIFSTQSMISGMDVLSIQGRVLGYGHSLWRDVE